MLLTVSQCERFTEKSLALGETPIFYTRKMRACLANAHGCLSRWSRYWLSMAVDGDAENVGRFRSKNHPFSLIWSRY